MWLIFLFMQVVVKTPQGLNEAITEFPEKGPNYYKRVELLNYHQLTPRQNDFLNRTDFMIDTTIYFSPAIEHQALPQATFDGTNYFVIWADDRRTTPGDNKRDIYGTRVSPGGQILDPNGIFIGATQSGGIVYIGTFPAVAYGAGVYLCVYEDFDWNSWTWDLWGVRVDTAGNVLDPNRIQITNRYTYEGMAKVAFDGINFLVVWDDYDGSIPDDDIWGARVSPQGIVLDPNGFPIHSNPNYKSIYPDVAFDGTNYMVVWTDERTPSWSIYFARVTPQGVVLDPAGYPICDLEPANANSPRITFGAGNYFVVWDDCRETWLKPYGARVTPQGVVLDPDGFSIAPTVEHGMTPSVTFDGINYFVTWVVQERGCYGARVSPSGYVVDSIPITIQTPYNSYSPDIISDGMNSFAVWSEDKYSDRDIFGARINQQGNVLDPNGFIVSSAVNTQEMSAIANDNQNYFVVWSDKHNTEDIYGKFVSPSGGSIGAPISISSRNWIEDWPQVAFNGVNYLVVWNGQFSTWDIFGARVSPSGQVLDPSGIAIGAWSGNQGYPAVAWGNGNWLVVWDDNRNGAEDIYGTRVNGQGQVLDPTHILISGAPNEQWFPAIAFDGTNYLVIWQDQRGGNFDIYCSRVDTAGNVLDPNGIVVSSADEHQYFPRVCFDGTNYFVVWMDWRNYGSTEWDIFGARVTPQGVVLDPAGIPICTAPYDQGYPNVIYDGENYIVLWEDYRSQETPDIYGAKINTSGVVVDSFIVSNERVNEISPALAKGSSFEHTLFTYAKQAPAPYDVLRIYGQYYPPVGIEEGEKLKVKSEKLKLEAYPNPFCKNIEVKYWMQDVGYRIQDASLKIYDVTGRLVKDFSRFTNYNLRPASIVWDGTDDFGRRLPAGIYFIRLESDGFKETEKVILLR